MGTKLTTKQFIQRAQLVHGNRYDYTNVAYVGANKKVSIGCSIHGTFNQFAMDHMKGSGCSFCNERQQLTVDQFISRANKNHQSKYTYESVAYKNVTTKVKITCPMHGVFEQTPKDHMRKYGCPSCGGTKKVTTEDFVVRANIVHKSKYDYSQTNLKGMNSKVTIGCPIHGEFVQRPADHTTGVGCPICGTLKQGGYTEEYFVNRPDKQHVESILYLIEVDNLYCKVGITEKKYLSDRFPGVRFKPVLQRKLSLYAAFNEEQRILNKFKQDRYKVKDLVQLRNGWTECFPLEMVNTIKQEMLLENTQ